MRTTLSDSIGRLAAVRQMAELAETLAQKRAAAVSGLWGGSVAAVVAGTLRHLKRPMLLVCGHLDEAEDLADDVELFSGKRPDILPALEFAGSLGRVSEEQVSNRLRLIAHFASEKDRWTESGVLVASIQSLMQSVPSRQQLGQLILPLKPGQKLEAEKLIVWLSEHGYNRLDQVEVPGDFAVRGGIIDIYLPGDFRKVRRAARPHRPRGFLRRSDRIHPAVRSGLARFGRHATVGVGSSTSRVSCPRRENPPAFSVICRPMESSRCGRRWKSPSSPKAISTGFRR